MKLPNGQRIRWRAIRAIVIFRADKIVWASHWRRCRPIKIARQQAVSNYICRVWRRQKANHCRIGITNQSLRAIQRISANPHECGSACELARAEIIGIGPHPSFRIIRKIISAAGGNGPTVIRSQSDRWSVKAPHTPENGAAEVNCESSQRSANLS